ncbi:MAG: type II toxin-antitoxin system HicA family toxin [bacterium]|nr:type II toxin-antitoxin system HicA family toxin [bacterium]
MSRLPRISGDRAVQALKKLGFAEVRQRGSHVVLRKETKEGAVGCVVPRHKELAVGTLRGILKQAKVAADEFVGQF